MSRPVGNLSVHSDSLLRPSCVRRRGVFRKIGPHPITANVVKWKIEKGREKGENMKRKGRVEKTAGKLMFNRSTMQKGGK
jgi:hypothetical protein